MSSSEMLGLTEEQVLKFVGTGNGVGKDEVVQALREAVLADVDARIAKKSEELWRKGQQAIVKLQEKHNDKSSKLAEQVAQMAAKQQFYEAENEKLKQVVDGLSRRFALLGAAFGNPSLSSPVDLAAALGAVAAGSSATSTTAASVDSWTPLRGDTAEAFAPFTPVSAMTASEAKGDAIKLATLPEVPVFPFFQKDSLVSPTTSSAAPPLSLSEALNTTGSTPLRTPLSLVSTLCTGCPQVPPFPVAGPPRTFNFTIRKADGADLGLSVSHDEKDQVLRVEGIRPEGAVEAWNRQCISGFAREKAVLVGDRIIKVNDVFQSPSQMLEECRVKQLLKLTIVRGEGPLPQGSAQAAPASPATKSSLSSMRAEAAAFVPFGASETPRKPPGLEMVEPSVASVATEA